MDEPPNDVPINAGVNARVAVLDDAAEAKERNDNRLAFREQLTVAQRALFDQIVAINGQDAYSATAVALGKLTPDQYLAVPNNADFPEIRNEDVGTENALQMFDHADLAQIYAMNKARAPPGVNPVTFAALRVAAVNLGWLKTQYEVVRLVPLANATAIYAADLAEIQAIWTNAKLAAFLIPLVAEHVFRNYGHHFLTADAAAYVERYKRTLHASMAVQVSTMLPPEALYHACFHWITPARAREVLTAQLQTDRIPEAIRLRYNSAPAGHALITTTCAVIEAMKAANLADAIAAEGKFDLAGIQAATALVKAKPTRFHKTPQAYRVAPAELAEVKQVAEAKIVAERFAPVCQGFIDAFLSGSPLGQAKALAKYADNNPVLKRRAANFFRALSRNKALTVAHLFSGEVAAVNENFG